MVMNENTRIAVCAYAGDQHQVIGALGLYLHHQCPVVVLSPEDSKAEITYPGIENRFAGKRAYIGQDSLDRQRLYLELLLTFPEKYFLVNDADSFCLAPELPRAIYAEEEVLWSSVVDDGIPGRETAYPDGYPRIAFQPPYFLSRRTIEALLKGTEQVRANPQLPFIDHYMLQLAMVSGCPYKSLPLAISCPISTDPPSAVEALRRVREDGFIFIHSVKKEEQVAEFVQHRQEFLRTHL